jgi:hypothetical protein
MHLKSKHANKLNRQAPQLARGCARRNILTAYTRALAKCASNQFCGAKESSYKAVDRCTHAPEIVLSILIIVANDPQETFSVDGSLNGQGLR